jgi:heme O synthase-like polyprenyltransferase
MGGWTGWVAKTVRSSASAVVEGQTWLGRQRHSWGLAMRMRIGYIASGVRTMVNWRLVLVEKAASGCFYIYLTVPASVLLNACGVAASRGVLSGFSIHRSGPLQYHRLFFSIFYLILRKYSIFFDYLAQTLRKDNL